MTRRQLIRAKYKVRKSRWERKHPLLSVYLWAISGWRVTMFIHGAYCGAGYFFGPPRFTSSPAFAYIQSFYVPIPVWGLFLMLVSLGLLDWHKEHFRWAHLTLGLFWTFWTVCLYLTTLDGTNTGWGGPMHTTVIALIHFRLALRK